MNNQHSRTSDKQKTRQNSARDTTRMRVMLFSKCSKFNIDFKNSAKNFKKNFCL